MLDSLLFSTFTQSCYISIIVDDKSQLNKVNIISPYFFTEWHFGDWKMNIVYVTIITTTE